MEFCVLVGSGLVFNLVGPFSSKEMAKQWADLNQIKNYLVGPMMPPGDLDPIHQP